MIQVLLYEDNENLRNSLKSLMQWQTDAELVAAFPDAATSINDIAFFKPDVILMDIDMPGINGIEALKMIRKKHPDLPVIMLTVFEDNDNIYHAICNGASGYILKKNFDQVIPAIKDVLSGGAPMTSTVARKVLTLFPKPAIGMHTEEAGLTTREQELLQFLIRGYSYKMIADEMNIALETVRSHIKKIYRKLHVNSATEAVYKSTQR